MKTKSIFTGILVVGLFTFNSCVKDGPVGPQGPQGNANVQSSAVTVTQWSWNTTYSYSSANITVPALTPDIVDRGAVMVYIYNGSTTWEALPFSSVISAGVTTHYEFVYTDNQVTIIISNSDLSIPNLQTSTFKIVCIAASIMTKHPNTNWKNYSEVQKVL
jgi:hypothetical protein